MKARAQPNLAMPAQGARACFQITVWVVRRDCIRLEVTCEGKHIAGSPVRAETTSAVLSALDSLLHGQDTCDIKVPARYAVGVRAESLVEAHTTGSRALALYIAASSLKRAVATLPP